MIIVSQDRKTIIDEIMLDIRNIGEYSKGFTIYEMIRNKNMGTYATEERAKEVLAEIIKSYRDYRTAECDGYTNVLQETAVYEMPLE